MYFLRNFLLFLVIIPPQFSYAGLFGIGDVEIVRNALVDAADVGNIKYVKSLIKNGYPVDSTDTKQQTALMKAAIRGNQDITKILVDVGADVNLQDTKGNTALHYAAEHDHIAAANEIMKSHRVNLKISNNKGHTPLQAAVKANGFNVAQLITKAALLIEPTMQTGALPEAAKSTGIYSRTVATGLGVAAGGAAIAVASGGGGGGGSESSGGGSGDEEEETTITIPDNTIDNGTPSSFETSEYTEQGGLGQINANYAYSRGYTGADITVAVVDTGVNLTHPDLAANVLVSASANCIGSGGDSSECIVNTGSGSVGDDNHSHGTHVAGIIAAVKNDSGMHGVAYNAKILPVKVLNPSGSSLDVAAGIDYARLNDAKVINLSLGSEASPTNPSPETTTAISSAMNNGILVFAATGNDFEDDPTNAVNPIWPARNAKTLNDEISTGAIIAVASVDSSSVISVFSNRCGDTKEWCMVAPGEAITSTVLGSAYDDYYGTSMATPQVSGAAAILLAAFPSLTPREVALILLNTADDLGVAGIDSIYGHGLLNLAAATAPNGVVIIPLSMTTSGSSSSLSGSHITLSSAFGGSLNSSNIPFAILDSYKRAYTLNLSDVTSSNINHNRLADNFEKFANAAISRLAMINMNNNLSIGFSSEASNIQPEQPGEEQGDVNYLSMVSEAEGIKQAVNYNIPVAEYFGFGAVEELDGSAFQGNALHGNPYLALAQDGISSVSKFSMEDGNIQANFAAFQGENQESGNDTSGMVSEIAVASSGFAIASQFGMIREQESFLGSSSSGAFAIGGDETPTWFYNLSASMKVAENIKLFGIFSQGITTPENSANSLIHSVSEIKSQSFAAGIMRNANFTENDTLGFAVSSPLRVVSGSATINTPSGADINGNIYRQNQALNLAASGMETDMEIFYKVPLDASILTVGAMRRLQPDNIEDAASEDIVMLKYGSRF